MRRRLASLFAGCLVLAAAVWADLALRARSALREGERYMEWHAHPELQRAWWDAWLKAEEKRLDGEAAGGRLTAQEARARRDVARAERDERAAESPLKLAVRWFETGADLFAVPPNPWTSKSRARLEEARGLWRRELAASGVRPEEHSFH